MNILKDFAASKGFELTEITLDGSPHEFKTPDKKKGWYWGSEVDGRITFSIGSWQTGEKYFYGGGTELTPELEEKLGKMKGAQVEARAKKHKAVSQTAQSLWADAKPLTDSNPYLLKKGFDKCKDLGAREILDQMGERMLVIPMQDIHGDIWNLQYIQGHGAKSFIAGGTTKELFFVFGKLPDGHLADIYIVEGFATGLTVHLATNQCTVVSFSSSNLPAITKILRQTYPHNRIVAAADNDHEKEENAGTLSLKKCDKLKNIICIQPQDLAPGESDFNDLMARIGLEEVGKEISRLVMLNSPIQKDTQTGFDIPPPHPTPVTHSGPVIDPLIRKFMNGVSVMPVKYNPETGREVMPLESEVAFHIMKYYEGRIVASQGSYFLYKENHWVEMDDGDRASVIIQAMVALNKKGTNSRYESIRRLFFSMAPKIQRNLFISNPYTINFLNGTLHIIENDNNWKMEFLAHNKLDYCTNVIPIKFDETRVIVNQEFEDMVSRILGGDAEKVRAVRQMYGAALAPIFPRIFMLHGRAGSGKSSLIIGARSLVHDGNWSGVAPHQMEGFQMEQMIGKLVNAVTDIKTTEPIKDDVIKQIEDRIPISINRKFKTAISAPIPAVHIFGGNDVPPTLDRGSGAHTRRWTFIKTEVFNANEEAYTRNFAARAIAKCPEGVVNFALLGLQDLLDNKGLYFNPESGKKDLGDWQTENDSLLSFIEDCRQGEGFGIAIDAEGYVPRSLLWEKFNIWHENAYNRKARIPKGKFFKSVLKNGHRVKKVNGIVVIEGFQAMNAADVHASIEGKLTMARGQGAEY